MKNTQYIINIKDTTDNKEYFVPSKYGDDISDKVIFRTKYDVALKIIIDKWLEAKRIKETNIYKDDCFILLKKNYLFTKDTYKDNDLECVTLKGEAIEYTKNLEATPINIDNFSSLDELVKVIVKDNKNNNEVVVYETKEEIDKEIKDIRDRLKGHLIDLGKDPDSVSLDYMPTIQSNYIFDYTYDYINEDYCKKGLVYTVKNNDHDVMYMADGDDIDKIDDIWKQMEKDREELMKVVEVKVEL